MNTNKLIGGMLALWLVYVVVAVTLCGLAIWAIVHFVAKYW